MVSIRTPIVTSALATIPDADTIVDEAIERLKEAGVITSDQLKTNFYKTLKTLEKTAEEVYREYEHRAFEKLKEDCLEILGNDATLKDAFDYTFPLAKEFEFRADRLRKTKASRALRNEGGHKLQDMRIQCDDRLAFLRSPRNA